MSQPTTDFNSDFYSISKSSSVQTCCVCLPWLGKNKRLWNITSSLLLHCKLEPKFTHDASSCSSMSPCLCWHKLSPLEAQEKLLEKRKPLTKLRKKAKQTKTSMQCTKHEEWENATERTHGKGQARYRAVCKRWETKRQCNAMLKGKDAW